MGADGRVAVWLQSVHSPNSIRAWFGESRKMGSGCLVGPDGRRAVQSSRVIEGAVY